MLQHSLNKASGILFNIKTQLCISSVVRYFSLVAESVEDDFGLGIFDDEWLVA